MPLTPALQRYVDDELARMPMLAERLCRQTVDALRAPPAIGETPTAAERTRRHELAQALQQQGTRFAHAFVEALAARIRLDSAGEMSPRAPELACRTRAASRSSTMPCTPPTSSSRAAPS